MRANRVHTTIVDKQSKTVSLTEMSCPWVENRDEKAAEKTSKYRPLHWELQQRYPEHRVTQYNIIMIVLRCYSREVSKALGQLVGEKVITSMLNIAHSFKILK